MNPVPKLVDFTSYNKSASAQFFFPVFRELQEPSETSVLSNVFAVRNLGQLWVLKGQCHGFNVERITSLHFLYCLYKPK